MLDTLLTIGYFLLGLSLLIVIHELGHYWAARIFGIKVEEFALFFGKKIVGFKRGDTEWRINMIPLGGYVKIVGMLDENLDPEQVKGEPEPWEFRAKPTWQRLIVMLGGIIMNVILGIILMFCFKYFYGDTKVPIANLEHGIYVAEGSVGYDMGFRTGDVPLTYKGDSLTYLEELKDPSYLVDNSKNFEVLRDGKVVKLEIADDYMDTFVDFDDAKKSIVAPNLEAILAVPSPEDNEKLREADKDTIPLRAYELGFRTGDVVVGVDDTPIERWYQFYDLLHDQPVQKAYHFNYGAEGQPLTSEIQAAHIAQVAPALSEPVPFLLVNTPGTNAALEEAQKEPVSLTAYEAGFRTGDVIVAVDSTPVKNWMEFNAALLEAKTEADSSVQVSVRRLNEVLELSAAIDSLPAFDSSYADLTPMPLLGKGPASKEQAFAGYGFGLAGAQIVVAGEGTYDSLEVAYMSYLEIEKLEQSYEFSVDRNGEQLKITATTDTNQRLGVVLNEKSVSQKIEYSFGEALPVGASAAFGVVTGTLKGLRAMFQGNANPRKSLSGPVKIAQIYGEASRERGWAGFWYLTAYLSMVLAVMNLLPIPILDGGQVLILSIEGVAGREIPLKAKEWILRISFYLVVGLMLLVVLNDLI